MELQAITYERIIEKYNGAPNTDYICNNFIKDLRRVLFIHGRFAVVRYSRGKYDIRLWDEASRRLREAYLDEDHEDLGEIVCENIEQFGFDVTLSIPYQDAQNIKDLVTEPEKDDIMVQWIITYINDVWCDGNKQLCNYTMKWLAAIIRGIKTTTIPHLQIQWHEKYIRIITGFLRTHVIGRDEENEIDQYANCMLTIVDEVYGCWDAMTSTGQPPVITISQRSIDNPELINYNNSLKYSSKRKCSQTYAQSQYSNLVKYMYGIPAPAMGKALLHYLQSIDISYSG